MPLSLHLEADGSVHIPETLFGLKFNFCVRTMYVMKKMVDDRGVIVHHELVFESREEGVGF